MPKPDVIVIGSGAGGGIAAKVLAENGKKVVLLEKGRNPFRGLDDPAGIHPSELSNDEVKDIRYFIAQDPFSEPRTFRTSASDGDRTFTGQVQALANAVGGGSVVYDSDSPRIDPGDFQLATILLAKEGLQLPMLEDWPITYNDLEPFYSEVERIIGVQGEAGADPFEGPRSSPYPMPPGYPKYSAILLENASRALGYHPFPTPQAINSIAYRGRPACTNCGFCSFGCPVHAKGSTAVTAVRDALLTGNLTLMPECFAFRLNTSPDGGSVRSVSFIDPRGNVQELEADAFVVACMPIETTRLLLLSANSQHPNGLGNSSDLLGRNLMFHIIVLAVGSFDPPTHTYRGRPITENFMDFVANPSFQYRGGIVELGASQYPISEALDYLSNGLTGSLHKTMMRQSLYRRRIATATMIGEDMPQLTNRVDLDPAVKDIYGYPVARVTYQNHPRDLAMADYFIPKLMEIVTAAGAQSTLAVNLSRESGGVPNTQHILGTARMGADPLQSVTDPLGKFHDLNNLYCADGSVFVTSTSVNPTLTLQALAYRMAANIISPGNPLSVLTKNTKR